MPRCLVFIFDLQLMYVVDGIVCFVMPFNSNLEVNCSGCVNYDCLDLTLFCVLTIIFLFAMILLLYLTVVLS